MTETAGTDRLAAERDSRTADAVRRERVRLLSFIRARVRDPLDAEDILQDVFTSLVEANRLLMPVEHVTAWLYRAARNRIIDVARRRRSVPAEDNRRDSAPDDDHRLLEELVPARELGPEDRYERRELVETIERAIAGLPPHQRAVFVAHEIEGASFREMAERFGVGLNTLLSRKRYAVRRLRKRLQSVFEESGR